MRMGNKVSIAGGKASAKIGFKYRPQFGVIVICASEAEHQKVYRQLASQGYKVKVVCV